MGRRNGPHPGWSEDRNHDTERDGRARRIRVGHREGIVVREKSGQRSIARADISKLRVADPSRRLRSGIIWTAVGAAAGAAVGALICLSCPNEGHGYKFVGPRVAIGVGAGALAFLPTP